MRADIVEKLLSLEENNDLILTKEEQDWIVFDWLKTHTKQKIKKEQLILKKEDKINGE